MSEIASPRPNVVLVGFMGTGKSSAGRLVAQKLGFQYIDTDQLIAQRAGMEIPHIFAQHGEAHFRDLEASALESLAHLERCVIATGGGVVLRESNRFRLRELGFVIGLMASKAVIFDRVSRNSRRPLLQTDDPRTTVHEMLAARAPLYEAVASLTIDTSTRSSPEVADLIVNAARHAFAWQSQP
jgi:shikimate kinase